MAEPDLHQETEVVVEPTLEETTNLEEPTLVEEPTESSTQVEETGELTAEPIADVSTLVEHLEADPEWFNGLKVSATVNGKPATPTIKELVDSYQIQEAAVDRLNEAKLKSQETNQWIADQQEAMKVQVGTAATLVQLAEQVFQSDVNQAKLDELRETDFTEYQKAKDVFEQRRTALDQVKEQVSGQLAQLLQPQPLTQEQVEDVRAQMVKEIPELDTDEARQQLAEYALSLGYTRDELALNADARLYIMAEKARRYDELQGKKDVAKKKVQEIPKVIKPGPTTESVKPTSDDRAEILYGSS